MQQLQF